MGTADGVVNIFTVEVLLEAAVVQAPSLTCRPSVVGAVVVDAPSPGRGDLVVNERRRFSAWVQVSAGSELVVSWP